MPINLECEKCKFKPDCNKRIKIICLTEAREAARVGKLARGNVK